MKTATFSVKICLDDDDEINPIELCDNLQQIIFEMGKDNSEIVSYKWAVSYTHLTLPTSDLV